MDLQPDYRLKCDYKRYARKQYHSCSLAHQDDERLVDYSNL